MTEADDGSMYELVREQPPLERLSAGSDYELMRSGNEYMCGEIETLRARVETLEAALKPFKIAADGFDECGCGDGLKLSTELVNVGMLRRAREALEDK